MKKFLLFLALCNLSYASELFMNLEGEGSINFQKTSNPNNSKHSLVYETVLAELKINGTTFEAFSMSAEQERAVYNIYFPGIFLSRTNGLYRWGIVPDERDFLYIFKDKSLKFKAANQEEKILSGNSISAKKYFLSNEIKRIKALALNDSSALLIINSNLNRLLNISYSKISGSKTLNMTTEHSLTKYGFNCVETKNNKDVISCSFGFLTTAKFVIP